MSRLDMRAAAIVGRERNVAILRGAPRILPGAPGSNWRFKTGELRGSVQTIFDSKTLPTVKRRQAWQDAICQIYLQVDCAAEQQDDYEGFVRELRFGAILSLSDRILVSRQGRIVEELSPTEATSETIMFAAVHEFGPRATRWWKSRVGRRGANELMSAENSLE
jgi:hypothetical protein